MVAIGSSPATSAYSPRSPSSSPRLLFTSMVVTRALLSVPRPPRIVSIALTIQAGGGHPARVVSPVLTELIHRLDFAAVDAKTVGQLAAVRERLFRHLPETRYCRIAELEYPVQCYLIRPLALGSFPSHRCSSISERDSSITSRLAPYSSRTFRPSFGRLSSSTTRVETPLCIIKSAQAIHGWPETMSVPPWYSLKLPKMSAFASAWMQQGCAARPRPRGRFSR